MLLASFMLVLMKGGKFNFHLTSIILFKFLLLLSSIIPISMRVNLDFAKILYCYKINIDKEIEGTIARNSTIPEDLGRI